MKKMKKLKKLSLENEMKKEAEQIERKSERTDLWMTLKCLMRWKKSFSIRFRITNTTKGIKKSSAKREKQACNRSTGSSADFGVRKCDDQRGE